MKMADFLIQKDTHPEEPDHECRDDNEGSETGLCSDCRDHASFCDTCKLSGCCAAKEQSFERESYLREQSAVDHKVNQGIQEAKLKKYGLSDY